MAGSKAYWDVSINGSFRGRMVFELYDEVVPRTTANFRGLCTSQPGYKGSLSHRIIPNFMSQWGDFTNGDGTGGRSIYGEKFPDESFQGRAGTHTGFGCLSMANSGPNTNGSQVFVCTGDTPWLDGKHVVLGNLVAGAEVLYAVDRCGSRDGRPTAQVAIIGCGLI
jgi:cyclophilin family peptidyl-prolyl cis-trans isomerase